MAKKERCEGVNALENAMRGLLWLDAETVKKIADGAPGPRRTAARIAVHALRYYEARDAENKGNPNHDPGNGQFTSGNGGGSGASVEPSSSTGSSGFQSEEEVKRYLSGSPKINRKETAKHISGTPEFEKYQQERRAAGRPPHSCVDPADVSAVEAEVMAKLKKGECTIVSKPDGSFRAYLS